MTVMTNPLALQEIQELTIHQLADLVNKLGGAYKVLRILRDEITITLKNEYTLNCTSTFNPSSFLGEQWSLWRGPRNGNGADGEIDQSERSLQLEKIDWSKVQFVHCLQNDEQILSGETKIQRLKESGDIYLGGNAFLSLWLNYQEAKNHSVLEWLNHAQGITCIDFMGSVLRNKDGHRYVLYLYRDDTDWKWSCWGSLHDLKWERHNLTGTIPKHTAPSY